MTKPILTRSDGRSIYNAKNGAGELSVEIIDKPCRDTMSNEIFDSQVTVSFAKKTYRGCGKKLSSNWE